MSYKPTTEDVLALRDYPLLAEHMDTLIGSLIVTLSRAEKGLQMAHPLDGICCNWDYDWMALRNSPTGSECYGLIRILSAQWPGSRTPGKHNGMPVPNYHRIDYWSTSQREARIDLMRFVLPILQDWGLNGVPS